MRPIIVRASSVITERSLSALTTTRAKIVSAIWSHVTWVRCATLLTASVCLVTRMINVVRAWYASIEPVWNPPAATETCLAGVMVISLLHAINVSKAKSASTIRWSLTFVPCRVMTRSSALRVSAVADLEGALVCQSHRFASMIAITSQVRSVGNFG